MWRLETIQEALTQPILLSGREPVGALSSHLPLQVSETGDSLLLELLCGSTDNPTSYNRPQSLSLKTAWALSSLKDSAERVTEHSLERQLLRLKGSC